MIYDKLSNAKLYLGFSSNLDTALRFIAEHDLNELPLGRTTILEDQIYIDVVLTNTEPLDTKRFEIHEKYIDIHIDIFGTERLDIGDGRHMTILESNYDNDLHFVDCNTLLECTIGPGNFLICMAEEPHKPEIAIETETSLKKSIVKVHI